VMLRLSRHPLLLLLGDVPSLAQGRAYAEFSCLAMFFYPSTERDHSQMGYQWLVHSHRLCRVTVRHIRSEPLYFCCTYEGGAGYRLVADAGGHYAEKPLDDALPNTCLSDNFW